MTDISIGIVFYIGLTGMVFSLVWLLIANPLFWLMKKPTKIKVQFPVILLLVATALTFSSIITYQAQFPDLAKAITALSYLIAFIGIVISSIWLLIIFIMKTFSKKSIKVKVRFPLVFLLLSTIFLFLPSMIMVVTATLLRSA